MHLRHAKIATCFAILTITIITNSTLIAETETKKAIEIEEERLDKLLSIKQNNHYIDSILKDGIEKIQYGDWTFLKTIEYDTLLLFITGINNLAKKESTHPFYLISRKTPDRIIKISMLGGLSNKDPRVRLFALTILKQMELTKDFKTIRQILSITRNETVYNSYYYFIDINLNIHIANLSIELLVLEKKIRRMAAVNFIKSYSFNPMAFLTISRANFIAINENISGEDEIDIPLKSFDESKLDHLITGLKNRDIYIKTECAKYIYNIYNDKKTSKQTKERIDKLLKPSFSLKREMIKEKYRMGFLFNKKTYNTFIIEGPSILRTVFQEYDKKKKK